MIIILSKNLFHIVINNYLVSTTMVFFKSVKVDVDAVLINLNGKRKKTVVYITGQTIDNKSIMVVVDDFNPYMYVELPVDTGIDWKSSTNFNLIKKCLTEVRHAKYFYQIRPVSVELEWRKKTFYANVKKEKGKMVEKLFPFAKVSYINYRDRWSASDSILKKSLDGRVKLNVYGLGEIFIKLHETNVDPIIQLFSTMKLNQGGWNSFQDKSSRVIEFPDGRKCSRCDLEFSVPYRELAPSDRDDVVYPTCMSFDIECNSWRINAFPDATNEPDCIFQVSAVFFRMSDKNENNWERVLLSIGNPRIDKNENIRCIEYKSERELIIGFKELIVEKDPMVIMGYNIMSFDIPYIIKRAQLSSNNCIKDFRELGNRKGKMSSKTMINWKSAAYGEQKMEFIDAHGRVFLDLYPIVKRNYKLSVYNLKSVSQKFLGVSKDPLSPQGIFKCYRMGMRDDAKGRQALGICGKYCVEDSMLVARLSNVFQVWIDATETARTCNIPISYLYTKGQQIRFFALVVKKAIHENYVVEKDAYVRKDHENYSGATVINPSPGIYNDIVPFDFASLYPTVMISNNISTETLVNDSEPNNIKDEDCNICEWDDHIGCSHDTEERKGPVKSVICAHHKYRFIKKERMKGMVACILESLLHERTLEKKVLKKRKEALKKLKLDKDLRIDGYDASTMEVMMIVSDKRQAALKVVCNSVYGAMGAQKGFLPCLPCAMCTTAWGRKSLMKAKDIMCNKYGGDIVYGDTDSVMINFKNVASKDLWDHCVKIDKLLETEFPPPMKLEFEDKIYKKFLIFSKKRYIAHIVEEDYDTLKNVQMKGVILARRDNSKFVSSVYKECIDMVFDSKTKEEVFDHFHERVLELFRRKDFDISQFIITKTVNDTETYKRDRLPENDQAERTRKLVAKKCDTERVFMDRSLPAHVYLALKMGRRGRPVVPGSRLEFVMTNRGEYNGALWEKIDSPSYVEKYSDIIKICPYYYMSKCVNPIEQLFEVCFGTKNIILRAYKTHVQKHKICRQLVLNTPKVDIV